MPEYPVVPQIDFSPLATLGDTWRNAQTRVTRQKLLSEIGQEGFEPGALAQKLLQAGDLEGATPFIKLAESAAQQKALQSYRDRSLDIQERSLEGGKPTDDMREYAAARGQGFGGSFLDYQREMKNLKEPQQTATTQKAILQADEALRSGEAAAGLLDDALKYNKDAYSGPGAGVWGQVTSQFGNKSGEATENLDNVVTRQALETLKSTFGGNPTEGERKVLLDLQGSVSKAPAVREAIYKRAKSLIESRMKYNRAQSESLRRGAYYQSGGAPTAAVTQPPPTDYSATDRGQQGPETTPVPDMSDPGAAMAQANASIASHDPGAAPKEGQRAHNAQTGQVIEWRNGQWIPVQ